jgi:hypothetical protein
MLEKMFSLIISVKALAWKLSQKVRNFVKPESYVILISDNRIRWRYVPKFFYCKNRYTLSFFFNDLIILLFNIKTVLGFVIFTKIKLTGG